MVLRTVLRRLLGSSRDRDAPTVEAARAAFAEGRLTEARHAADRVLRAEPDRVEAYVLRAAIAKNERRFADAIEDYERGLALRPDSIDLRLRLGSVLHRTGRFEDALAAFERVAALAPGHGLAHMNVGLMLRELARFEEAEAALARALELDPSLRVARCHQASVIYDQGRTEEAKRILERVLGEDPQDVEAHWVLAMIALSEGDLEAGWRHYAYRLERHDAFVRSRGLRQWSPGPAEPGSVLVLAEQGLGDEIMFASCFGDLAARVPQLVIECDPRLGTLFARSFPQARIDATRNPERASQPPAAGIAAEIPAGSLPAIFRRRAADFPRHRGYLRADPARVAYWRDRLAALGPGMKIGISWVGGAMKTRRSLRSVPLDGLAPILSIPGTCFVSLQYGAAQDDLKAASSPHARIASFSEAIADYAETASLVSALDLVISVTTAIVHLAGALGRPAWVLVPAVPEWRYQRHGDSMLWYPAVRLYRQQRLGEWQPVVASIARDLRAQVARAPAAGGCDAGVA